MLTSENGMIQVQTTLVASPRNHLYRTLVRIVIKAPGPGRELYHIRNRANEFDLKATFDRSEHDLVDEPAQNFDRLGSCLQVVEGLVEVRDLIPIELCQLRVKTRGGQGRFFDLGLQL